MTKKKWIIWIFLMVVGMLSIQARDLEFPKIVGNYTIINNFIGGSGGDTSNFQLSNVSNNTINPSQLDNNTIIRTSNLSNILVSNSTTASNVNCAGIQGATSNLCTITSGGGSSTNFITPKYTNYDYWSLEEFYGDATADFPHIFVGGTLSNFQNARDYEYFGDYNSVWQLATSAGATANSFFDYGSVSDTSQLNRGLNLTKGFRMDARISPINITGFEYIFCCGAISSPSNQDFRILKNGLAICFNGSNGGNGGNGSVDKPLYWETFAKTTNRMIQTNLTDFVVNDKFVNLSIISNNSEANFYINGSLVSNILWSNLNDTPSRTPFVGCALQNNGVARAQSVAIDFFNYGVNR